MADSNDSHRGLETAANAAQLAHAAANIARGAAQGGLYGAGAAAAKEAAPFLVKVIAGIIVVVILVPMLVFTALPNMFFGFDSSDVEDIADMTAQAKEVGYTYLTMNDFENADINSVTAGIAAQYEDDGIEIDHIEVNGSLEEDDLLWFIAINSVAYQQDLDVMTAQEVRSFFMSWLTFTPTLDSEDTGDDGVKTTLNIVVGSLDHEELMEQLGFDENARIWAGALYETLSESGALDLYSSYFEAYQPDYSGGGPLQGGDRYEGGHSNDIDISQFVSPGTKNNLDLANYALQAWQHNWGYVWGTYGSVLTESLLEYKVGQYPEGVGAYEDFIRANWLGRRCTDCVGLIKGYGWLDTGTLTMRYGTNGMPDYGANTMFLAAQNAGVSGRDYGVISTMPEIKGLAVRMDGHVGVYIGNGYVIEAANTSTGVIRTQLAGRGWTHWYKIPYISYIG